MTDFMQILFEYILDHTHETYCLRTKRAEYSTYRDSAARKLHEQLTREQQNLFEEIENYDGQIRDEELYAMFLAVFDQTAALFQRHTA